MAKPSVSLVKEWDLVDSTDSYTIHVGTAVFPEDYYKVTTKDSETGNCKVKLFYGEMAWSDAERFAYDHEFQQIYK